MDEGDFNNKNFKHDTTWKITEGNYAKANGAISIAAAADESDNDGEPKLCAQEWGKCQCTGTVYYGVDKGGVLDKSKGWTKK
jgi:hypothetical protein